MCERVRPGCVRPWFCGKDSHPGERKWNFESITECGDDAEETTDLAGPSAGQSAVQTKTLKRIIRLLVR